MRSSLLLLGIALTLTAADFRAAAVKVDITPDQPQWLMGYAARKSTGVHDRIFHRIAVLDDGTTEFYLISTELCVFSPTVYDDFTRDLQQRAGINPLHVWWTTTHTHSAPELGPPGVYDILLKGRSDHEWSREYLGFVRDRLFEGVQQAKSRLAPARLGVGTGMSMANINRRARDVDGKISLGLNPDGVVDRQIGLLKIERADGSGPIALIANYALHGTVLGGRWMQISGDGPGVVADYVEQKNGNAPMLFINGAAGNIAPIYSVYDTPAAGHLRQFNVMLGDRILETARNTAASAASVQLATSERIVETARKPELGWLPELHRYAAKSTDGRPLVRIPVRFLRINDVLLWAAPVEMFCEISMRVRNESPFRHTFYFGYTNGWLGYLPTATAFHEGGYEPSTSPFTDRAEEDFLRVVLTYIQGLPRNK